MAGVAASNEEAVEAWNGVLFRPGRPEGSALGLDAAERVCPKSAAALREALAEFAGPDGVWVPASTWIVSARAPALGKNLDA